MSDLQSKPIDHSEAHCTCDHCGPACECTTCGSRHRPPEWHQKYLDRNVCVECKDFVTDYYMLIDPVWEQTKGGDGMLHLKCVEKRLDRELSRSDFNGRAPVNDWVFWLMDRA